MLQGHFLDSTGLHTLCFGWVRFPCCFKPSTHTVTCKSPVQVGISSSCIAGYVQCVITGHALPTLGCSATKVKCLLCICFYVMTSMVLVMEIFEQLELADFIICELLIKGGSLLSFPMPTFSSFVCCISIVPHVVTHALQADSVQSTN